MWFKSKFGMNSLFFGAIDIIVRFWTAEELQNRLQKAIIMLRFSIHCSKKILPLVLVKHLLNVSILMGSSLLTVDSVNLKGSSIKYLGTYSNLGGFEKLDKPFWRYRKKVNIGGVEGQKCLKKTYLRQLQRTWFVFI